MAEGLVRLAHSGSWLPAALQDQGIQALPMIGGVPSSTLVMSRQEPHHTVSAVMVHWWWLGEVPASGGRRVRLKCRSWLQATLRLGWEMQARWKCKRSGECL